MRSMSSKIGWIVVLLATVNLATLALAQVPLAPSPEWTQAMPAGPVAGTKITEEYAIVQMRRQEELTRRIQDKRAKAAKRAKHRNVVEIKTTAA